MSCKFKAILSVNLFKKPGVSWKKNPGFRGLKISQKPRVSGIGGNRGNNPSKLPFYFNNHLFVCIKQINGA